MPVFDGKRGVPGASGEGDFADSRGKGVGSVERTRHCLSS